MPRGKSQAPQDFDCDRLIRVRPASNVDRKAQLRKFASSEKKERKQFNNYTETRIVIHLTQEIDKFHQCDRRKYRECSKIFNFNKNCLQRNRI